MKALLDAGKYFLRKQNWSEGSAEEELIDVAIRSMGLSELKPFNPKEKIIEFKMDSAASKKSLAKLTEDEAVTVALRALDTAAESDTATGGVDRNAKIFPVIKIVSRDGITTLPEKRIATLFKRGVVTQR